MDITGHTMPNLVYVSREKRPGSPHHFKAGALNVLVSKTNHPQDLLNFHVCNFIHVGIFRSVANPLYPFQNENKK